MRKNKRLASEIIEELANVSKAKDICVVCMAAVTISIAIIGLRNNKK